MFYNEAPIPSSADTGARRRLNSFLMCNKFPTAPSDGEQQGLASMKDDIQAGKFNESLFHTISMMYPILHLWRLLRLILLYQQKIL